MNLRGNPTVVRWGDRRVLTVPAMSSVDEQQFVDLDLGEPRELVVTLTATAVPPVANLATTWRLYWGAGAAMVVEQVTVPVSDGAAPLPLVVRRSASKLRVAAVVSSTVPLAARDVTLSAFAGPVMGGR